LTGVNPEQEDRVPYRLLNEGNLDEIAPQDLGSARAFIAGTWLRADPGFEQIQGLPRVIEVAQAECAPLSREFSGRASLPG
jgi:hypothetical protein